MARPKSMQLTPQELRIMQVLWREGPMGVQGVVERLEAELAYTTVQTMLNVLHRKGRLARKLKNRAFVYRPLESREKVSGGALHDLLDRIFDGSVENLLTNLIQTRQIDRAELARLARKVSEAEGDDDDGTH